MDDDTKDESKRPLVKVCFPLPEGNSSGNTAEWMWTAVVGPGEYRIENSPFDLYGFSYQDVVHASEKDDVVMFDWIVRRGGHSTYRVFLRKDVTPKCQRFLDYWQPIQSLGCSYEGANQRLLAIDVEPLTNIYDVYRLLERGEADGVWEFEEAHCGHPVQKS